MSEQAFPDRHLLVLEPGRADRHYWRDLWAYRELFAILAWRDVAVRYKQTVIGIARALGMPWPDPDALARNVRTRLGRGTFVTQLRTILS